MNDDQIITALYNACQALQDLEEVAATDYRRLSDKTRLMLEELSAHLPVEIDPDPGCFRPENAVHCF